MPDLVEQLEATRDDYTSERQWHKLLMDAYSGGGGFQGSAKQPRYGFWGAAASVYTDAFHSLDHLQLNSAHPDTYLDRFPREDLAKFRTRVQGAHYANYIAPMTDLKLSFMQRRELTVENRPDKLDAWRENVDGRGTTWDEITPDMWLRAAVLGWFPAVIDMPMAPTSADGSPLLITRAAADQLGLVPTITPLFPANLTDYQCDHRGNFQWAKIRTDHLVQPSPWDRKSHISRYTIWYPDRFDKFEVTTNPETGDKSARMIAQDQPHAFGEVPLAIARYKPSPDDPIKGIAMHGQESVEARALFNRQSELDEHMRGQVFAILVLAAEENEEVGEITVGTDNGIYLDPNATQSHYFLSPDASVAGSYEKRIEVTIEEMYRQARIEFARPTTSRQATSGIARKFEFAQTDRALVDFARNLALFEEHVDMLVGRALNVPEDDLRAITYISPASFDVEDLQGDVELAVAAIESLGVGDTAARMIRTRLIQQLLPNLSDDVMATIEGELEQQARDDVQARAFVQTLNDAAAEEPDEPPAEQPTAE